MTDDDLRVAVLEIFAEAQNLGTPPKLTWTSKGLAWNRGRDGAPKIHANAYERRMALEARKRERRRAGLPKLTGAAHPTGAYSGRPAPRWQPGHTVGPWTVVGYVGKHPRSGALLYDMRCGCGAVVRYTTAGARAGKYGCRACWRSGVRR